MTQETGRQERGATRRLPAWLASAFLHVALVLLLPLLLAAPHRTVPVPRERAVGLVLAQPTPERVVYLSEPEAAAAETDPGDLLQALPPQVVQPTIQLPSAVETPLPRGPLVTATRPGPGIVAGRLPSGVDAGPILAAEAARRAREAAAGPVTQVGLFGAAPAAGRSFVFLIDRSKSMGNQGLGALDAAERELLRNLSALQPQHRFQVIAYHHRCVYLLERKLLPATTENLAALEGHLTNLAAFGSTHHDQALMSALNLEPDAIFVLTDGGEPALTAGQLQRIRRLARGKTTIHCIQFGFHARQSSGNFLERLASENGGGYGYVDMSRN